jgi:NADH-quinone oxidoreductase subunit K
MSVTPTWYLVLGAALFTIGAIGLMVRRNPLIMFMCVELMLNAVNLSFVTFARELNDVAGQTVVFFVMVVAAAEVVVGLGLVVAVMRRRPGATADDISALRG